MSEQKNEVPDQSVDNQPTMEAESPLGEQVDAGNDEAQDEFQEEPEETPEEGGEEQTDPEAGSEPSDGVPNSPATE